MSCFVTEKFGRYFWRGVEVRKGRQAILALCPVFLRLHFSTFYFFFSHLLRDYGLKYGSPGAGFAFGIFKTDAEKDGAA
jgi:hypothetical protein